MVLSWVASIVGAALDEGRGGASIGVVMEEEGSGVGAVGAKEGVGAVAVAAVGSVVAASAAGSDTAGGLAHSTAGTAVGSFSGGGVGSEGCRGTLGSTDESEEAARRLLKDTGKAETTELEWGIEKAGLGFDSGGLNKLPDAAPLDKSVPVESSVDFWRTAPKLNCPAPLARAVSPKENEVAVGLMDESLASSPGPTRSPEKLPRVSPPTVFIGCGSMLRAVVEDVGLSPEVFGGTLEDPGPRAEEIDSSMVCPNIILPFPLKENLFISFAEET